MIPILYEKNDTEFNDNGLGRLRDCITCTVTEERNGIYELDFEYPVNGQNYNDIQIGRIVAVEHDDSGDIQYFDIMGYEAPIEGIVTFHCVHISYRQSYMTVNGSNVVSLADAFTRLKDNASPTNPFVYWTDKTSTGYVGAFDGVPKTVRSMLGGVEGSILDAYGGEYEWDRFTVKLWSARGQYRDFAIRYGVNMTAYQDETDSSSCYSSIIPYWTDGTTTIVGDKQTLSSLPPSGRDACIPMDVSDKFDTADGTVPTKAQINAMGLSVLNQGSPYLPTQNITVSFVRLQDTPEYSQFSSLLRCGLCDTIKVIFPDYNSSGTFKIVRTVWDVLGERYNEMELGDLSVSLSEALGINDIQKDSKTTIEQLMSAIEPNFIQTAMSSAQTLSQNSVTVLNMATVTRSAGSKLTLNTSTHRVVVGAGVKYVRISGSAYITTLGSSGAKNIYLYVNENIVCRSLSNLTTNYNMITASPVVVPVSEGDTISLRALSSNGATTQISNEAYSTKLLVEVVG